MATSGTVGRTRINTRMVIDHAFRRARIPPQKITREHIHTAKELLHMVLSSWSNKSISLWAVQSHLLPMYAGKQTVPLPVGTIDALNANLRQINRLRGYASSSEGDADEAFDGDISTACSQLTDGGWIALEFETPVAPVNFGILPGNTGNWSFKLQTSEDGAMWHTVDERSADMTDGQWLWWDVQGIPPVEYVRILADAGTVLNVREFVVANNAQEIPFGKINRDDYMNMPNKSYQSRPTQYWYDKQVPAPNMVLWPAPAPQYTFWQIVLTTQRLIQDVGALTDELELPQGGFLAAVTTLAWHVAQTIDDAKADPAALVAPMQMALNDFWAGQTDSSPSRLAFNISPYTR